jgi:hypothetical protein
MRRLRRRHGPAISSRLAPIFRRPRLLARVARWVCRAGLDGQGETGPRAGRIRAGGDVERPQTGPHRVGPPGRPPARCGPVSAGRREARDQGRGGNATSGRRSLGASARDPARVVSPSLSRSAVAPGREGARPVEPPLCQRSRLVRPRVVSLAAAACRTKPHAPAERDRPDAGGRPRRRPTLDGRSAGAVACDRYQARPWSRMSGRFSSVPRMPP